ncbi:hypothetical protein EB844_02595 [Paracoccus pantotrophus]|nr:hypothetical protein EB844_02595 [Paracoccus pantotrophus]
MAIRQDVGSPAKIALGRIMNCSGVQIFGTAILCFAPSDCPDPEKSLACGLEMVLLQVQVVRIT